jgi:dTDP-4-amino-4,6-dideoxygalactose transaminase
MPGDPAPQPAGEPRIPLMRPAVGEEEIEAAARVLRSGWLTQGPEVRAFEAEFAAFTGAAEAVAVSSGTAALELILHALGVGPGDEVVTVSHSFIATANVIRRAGAKPVFVDIAPGGFNMDPERAAEAIGPRTAAILAVHQIGMPCDLAALAAIAEARGVPLIEDAACAAGSEILWGSGNPSTATRSSVAASGSIRGTEQRRHSPRTGGEEWEKIGRPRGIAAAFSFHPRKILTTGDGGMVTTGDAALAARMRRLRVHGIDVEADVRHRSGVVTEVYAEPGFNMRLTDVQAAIGRVQLGRLAAAVARRRTLARRYADRLQAVAGLRVPAEPAWARSNWQSYCVGLPDGADQAHVMGHLAGRGIASRRGILCAHREPAYPPGSWTCRPGTEACACAGGGCARLKESERAQDRSILIPLFDTMREEEQDAVAEALAEACRS